MNLSEYYESIEMLSSKSKRLMESSMDDALVNLEKLKIVLDNNQIIKNILQPIKETEFDYKSQKFIDNYWSTRCRFNIPVDELNHMKAIYEYLTDIINEKKSFRRLCLDFRRNIQDEALIGFLDELYKPLYDYIFIKLKTKIHELESKERRMGNKDSGISNYGVIQQIQGGVNGNVIASGRDTTYTNAITTNERDNIEEIIDVIKNLLQKETMDAKVKEDIIDDIDTINEQLNNQDGPKLLRIKKALVNIGTTVSNGLIIGIPLLNNLDKFKEVIQKLFGC